MTDTTSDDPLVKYVLMRTDVPDYKSGKHMAQSNHAGTHFMAQAMKHSDFSFQSHVNAWLAEGNGFGTCITKAVTYRQMRRAMERAKIGGLFHGLVHDPEYPVQDGDRMQHLPIDTCAYIFGPRSRCWPIVEEFPLFKEPA